MMRIFAMLCDSNAHDMELIYYYIQDEEEDHYLTLEMKWKCKRCGVKFWLKQGKHIKK